jgi:hypothetical protein
MAFTWRDELVDNLFWDICRGARRRSQGAIVGTCTESLIFSLEYLGRHNKSHVIATALIVSVIIPPTAAVATMSMNEIGVDNRQLLQYCWNVERRC